LLRIGGKSSAIATTVPVKSRITRARELEEHNRVLGRDRILEATASAANAFDSG